MANVNIGINVVWDNQKQMQQAKTDLLALGKTALLSADDFGKTGTEINKSFTKILPTIKTSTQALKTFTTEGYMAWVNYQKEVDEATKGQQKALANQVKNMQAGFDKLAKSPDATISKMKEYLMSMQSVQSQLDRVAKLNKTATASFSSTSFLKTVEKQKNATKAWANEFVAVSQAMDTIKKKGATLELGNASGKQSANIKALRTEYESLQTQLNSMDVSKFNKSMQLQYSYTESTKGVLEALKEKYKTLDTAIKGMISSGDIKNLDSYKAQLQSVSNSITKLQDASERFDKEGFFSNLDKNSEAIESMDGRLAAVNARMKMLRSTIIKFTESGKANAEEIEELKTEYSKLSKEQAVLQKSTNGTATRIKNLIKSFVSAQAIVWGVRMVFNKFVGTLKEASEVAAAAEETMNLFDVVFEGVGDSADEMASRMSKAFGVAQSSIAQGLSTLGDFAEGLGMSNENALDFADTLSSRMLDVISFKNVTGDTTDILKNLASGLAGNTENFRTWGIVIKESSVKLWLAKNNMDKLTGTALELAKVQARAALFMEQSTNAAGDMARTFDSTTNIARRLTEAHKQLNENIGSKVNLLVTPIRKWALNIVESWNLATAAKKAYVDVDMSNEGKNTLEDNNEIIQSYFRAAKISEIKSGSSKVGYIGQGNNRFVGEDSNKIYFKDFSIMVDALGGSIEDTIKSLDDLGIEYDKNYANIKQAMQDAKESKKLNKIANDELEEFGETLALWSSSGNGGIYSEITENLKSLTTPFETATGTERTPTELAQSYQAQLKPMFESAYNDLTQAQNSGNEALEEKATAVIGQIVKQYKDAQSVIDQEEKNAKDDADNAAALADAVNAFKTSMSSILSNIATMNTNISSLMRNAGVSASMIGTDSSLVSIEQNRATAISGVKAQNQQAQEDFATKQNVPLSRYKTYEKVSKNISPSLISMFKKPEGFDEYENLLDAQNKSLKTTNTYYDLLAINAKEQLGYSDSQLEISSKTIEDYKTLLDETLKDLKLKVKNGEVTQQYYDDEKKILGEHVSTLESINFKQLKESLSSLSTINTSRSLNIGGGGLYSSATQTYQESLSKLGEIRAKVVAGSNSGIMSDKDADMLALKLSDIKEAYEADKEQAYLDATGISTGADAVLIANLKSIFEGTEIENMFKGLIDSIKGLFSQGDENGDGAGIFSGLISSISSLFSQGDESGEGKGALSGVGSVFSAVSSEFGDFANILGPIIKALAYILSKTEAFQEVISILTDALDKLAPLFDSFLQPLMLIMQPLVDLLTDILVPILEMLFPVIKAIMFVLIPLVAVIDTLQVYMTALGKTIKAIVTFHWWDIDDAWKDAAKRTGEIWDGVNDQLEELKDMTLDTTEGLTEANADYVDAVNDMVTNGLLTGQEALQMIASEAGTSYTGDNYRYMGTDSYNKGAGTVNIGTVTIDAKGKTMEEITEELRQMSYETSVTGGVSY